MKYLYKVYSGYDGFTPRRIQERLLPRRLLQLGWTRYIDSVEVGHEVWVYFHGPHRFEPGVYVKGFVRSIDSNRFHVFLRVREFSPHRPLTDPETSRRVAEVVAARGRQVFLYPEQWDTPAACNVDSTAESCRAHHCGSCAVWQKLPMMEPGAFGPPHRLPVQLIREFVPAYWVIPSRCYLHRVGRIADGVRRTSELFGRYKVGDDALSFPLALGVYEALRKRNLLDFDCIVPIPLSPDKAEAGEIHRTRLLARELASLLGTRMVELLELRHPISKHKLRTGQGLTALQFERQYAAALQVEEKAKDFERILLVDDVCTEGSTLRCAATAICAVNPDCEIVAATVGQMILKAVVKDEGQLVV